MLFVRYTFWLSNATKNGSFLTCLTCPGLVLSEEERPGKMAGEIQFRENELLAGFCIYPKTEHQSCNVWPFPVFHKRSLLETFHSFLLHCLCDLCCGFLYVTLKNHWSWKCPFSPSPSTTVSGLLPLSPLHMVCPPWTNLWSYYLLLQTSPQESNSAMTAIRNLPTLHS